MIKARDFRSETFKPVAQAIGEMTLAWNDLHQTLGVLFWMVSKTSNALAPLAVWHSSKIDRAQRDMLKALVNLDALGHTLDPDLKKEINWILCEVGELEDRRNDAVHSPMLQSSDAGGVGVAAHQFGHQRAKKLAGKDLVREFRWFYDAAVVLRDYAGAVSLMMRDQPMTLPERPRLPNRGDPN